MKLYTLDQLRLKAINFDSDPENALNNLIGNNAIRSFLLALVEEELGEIKDQIRKGELK